MTVIYTVGVYYATSRPPADHAYAEVEVEGADCFAGTALARLTAAQMVGTSAEDCVMSTRTQIISMEA